MLLSKYKSPVVIQKFIEKVKYGDKRVILVNGKAVGLLIEFLKVVLLRQICI